MPYGQDSSMLLSSTSDNGLIDQNKIVVGFRHSFFSTSRFFVVSLQPNRQKEEIMSINEAQDEIIEEFAGFDDWMDKYQLLIDLGNEQAPLPEEQKTEQNLIDGCQSRVWLQADYVDGRLIFTAESDALIVKGIVTLLIRVLSDHTPQEILDADLYFIDQIGLKEHLSPTRSNGLLAMVKQIRAYAVAYTMK